LNDVYDILSYLCIKYSVTALEEMPIDTKVAKKLKGLKFRKNQIKYIYIYIYIYIILKNLKIALV